MVIDQYQEIGTLGRTLGIWEIKEISEDKKGIRDVESEDQSNSSDN